MSLTTDKNSPCLDKIKDNGQQTCYLVLSDEERAKGFVRPVRTSYRHVGKFHKEWKNIEERDEPSKNDDEKMLTHRMPSLRDGKGKPIGHRLFTKEEAETITKNKGFEKACGTVTTMGLELSETYARDPKFYGATFCCGCGTHLPVGEYGEFVWEGTDEKVGL